VPVWIDDGQLGPFDPIPDGVRDGLSQAKVLLAWYSHAYPTRRACREELTLALLAAENLGQGDRRVLVVNSESGLDHVLKAQLLDRRFATADQPPTARPDPTDAGAARCRAQPNRAVSVAPVKAATRPPTHGEPDAPNIGCFPPGVCRAGIS